MLTSSFVPGNSLLHRASPAVKLGGLLIVTTALVAVPRPWMVGAVGGVVLVAGLLCGLGPVRMWSLFWAMRWLVLVLAPFQVWAAGWERAVVVVGGLVVAVIAAGVVTSTTRVADMMDTIVTGLRPFERVGVDAERVGLTMALAIRAVPVVERTMAECVEARRARGLERSPRALLVPFVVRTVRHAERVGEALAARGLDDPDPAHRVTERSSEGR